MRVEGEMGWKLQYDNAGNRGKEGWTIDERRII
jgi:hypothetical protein